MEKLKSLLVSGYAYTEKGDRNLEGKFKIKRNVLNDANIPVFGYLENKKRGKVIKLEQTSVSNKLAIAVLASISDPGIISRILKTGARLDSGEYDFTYSRRIFAWCMTFNYDEFNGKTPKEIYNVDSVSAVDCPCCCFTNIFVPCNSERINNNLATLLSRWKRYNKTETKLAGGPARFTYEQFNNLFNKYNINLKRYINNNIPNKIKDIKELANVYEQEFLKRIRERNKKIIEKYKNHKVIKYYLSDNGSLICELGGLIPRRQRG